MSTKAHSLRVVPRRPSDTERVRDWYAQLPAGPGIEPSRLTAWSLRELSRATGIPMLHLPTVLWQLGWRACRPHGATVAVELWQPPEWIEPAPADHAAGQPEQEKDSARVICFGHTSRGVPPPHQNGPVPPGVCPLPERMENDQ